MPSLRSIARNAFLLGLASGVAEVAVQAFRKFYLVQMVFRGFDYWWLTPLVLGAGALAAAMVTAGAVCLLRRAAFKHLPLLAAALVASANLVLLIPGLHPFAQVVLTLGIAWQLVRFLSRRSDSVDRFNRPAFGLTLLLVGFGLAGHVWDWGRDRPVAAADPQLPNVLLVVLDTVEASAFGEYALHQESSPFAAPLARRGVQFSNAYSVAPWTGAGHAGLFTGRWANELSITWETPLDSTFETLAEALAALGYRTFGAVANTEYVSAETGLARGFQDFSDYRLTPLRLMLLPALGRRVWGTGLMTRWLSSHEDPVRVHADEVTGALVRWLDRRSDKSPFFAFLNYMEAHAPYYPPATYWTQFVGPGEPRRLDVEISERWPPEEVAIRKRAYGACINYLDRKMADLFSELERRSLTRNTIVILTSDHGEEFYEHGVMGHANSIHVAGLHVPLIVSWPGRVPSGQVVADPVSTRQIPATVLELIQRPGRFPGPALLRTSSDGGGAPPREPLRFWVPHAPKLPASYPISQGPLSAILADGYWYLSDKDENEQLYDAVNDPGQHTDLVRRPEFRVVLEEARRMKKTFFR